MKAMRLLILSCLLSVWAVSGVFAQEDMGNALTYNVEAFGSAASGDYTPFWLVSNRYGVVPVDAGNGYLKAGAFYDGTFGRGFRWSAGLDVVAVAPRYRNVYIHQLYAELGYKSLLLSIGSKEKYLSLWDKRLSSGDMVLSSNAAPIPELRISMPEYTNVPLLGGWMQVKADFSVGRSFDAAYMEDFAHADQQYNEKVLWHHKSGYFRIKDTRHDFPLSLEFGVVHLAQWGGTSTNPALGKQPSSFKDFLRIVGAKEGGENSSWSDQENVLGCHSGSYDMRLGFTRKNWAAYAYYQHYFEDKSGVIMENGLDGLWGVQIDLPKFPWLRKVVVERLETRNQSGPIHFIWFDHTLHPGRGGGGDDYYNNGEYTAGASYYNRSVGSPLLLSPEYNDDGSVGFRSTRVCAWHVGLEGSLSPQLDYRILVTNVRNWGTPVYPFLDIKSCTSELFEVSYRHPRLPGWLFTGSFAADGGSMYGTSVGFGLSVSKSGLLTF